MTCPATDPSPCTDQTPCPSCPRAELDCPGCGHARHPFAACYVHVHGERRCFCQEAMKADQP